MPPWLHGEVARRMAERLPIIKLQPQHVADWSAFLGASQALLKQVYPKAQVFAVEAEAAPAGPRAWWSPARWRSPRPPLAVAEDAVPAGQAQLVWANMALHWAADPQALMRHWHSVLAVDGFLMFSTLGPGSLTPLRELYAGQRWGPPFAPFVDMHDFGDMLVEAGFADPVMDQEQLTLTWSSADALVAELRSLGGNAHVARRPGLRTPRWRHKLLQALQDRADARGRIALSFEIVYGHAFKPLPRPRVAPQTNLALDDMRAMVRAGRQRG